MTYSKNVKLILDILADEVKGDVSSALKKMDEEYSMTWVYKKGDTLFPQTKPDFSKGMKEVYPIKGRQYEILNIAEGENVVMIEMIESYPDPETNKVYRTPLVLISEIKDGKIKLGRHYCDPDISWLNLTSEQVNKAYPQTAVKITIK